ncbi:hypothetical protein BURK1_03517 [Burkholderiales bacterium]|nr:hypothetical protein BURK1_03517 [Burkholderiales bacterium]
MERRDTPTVAPTAAAAAGAVPPPANAWPPVGGAFAASIVIHALAIASLGAMFVRPDGGSAGAASTALHAVLVGAAAVDPLPDDLASPPVLASVAAAIVGPLPDPPRVRAAVAPAPWAGMPARIDAPAGIQGGWRVSEGVAIIETRNVVQLGEDIERRILRGFPGEPEYPVRLKPPETIGYPIEALDAGVEGRVLVWFGVDEEGSVVDKEALDGPPELMAWVLERVDRLVHEPARVGTRPVRAWVALEVHFSRVTADEARGRVAAEPARKAAASAK